ncbi:MAG TPA: V4R domain-containing protein [Gemmatimonadaceae bacterium]|nr:V4R domain-containing protein [Gemmatimonadaceae bacterium]
MSESIPMTESAMVGLTRDTLGSLHGALFRDLGVNAAGYLQAAGYAGGAALFSAFGDWCARHGHGAPEAIAAQDFERRASEFFHALGWGSLAVGTLHGAVATLDSADWAEANADAAMPFPGCHLSSGMLADFFGRLAGAPMAVMEVECRSTGAHRCRFLLGSGEALQHIYDAMSQGTPYEDAAAALA